MYSFKTVCKEHEKGPSENFQLAYFQVLATCLNFLRIKHAMGIEKGNQLLQGAIKRLRD